jgi:hypothetical protein
MSVIFGIKAKIKVTIHEKTTVSSSMSKILFPRLLAKLALIINGRK